MSSYNELVSYSRQLERRLATVERQEPNSYSKSEADSLFVTYAYATENFIDIGAYADFLNVDGGATGAILHTQIFDHGIEARDGVWGGGGANDDLILEGTSHATKTSSYIIMQPTGGNVGIGTSTPSSNLTVGSSGDTAIQVNSTSASASPGFIFGNATRYWDLFINGTGGKFMLRDISAGYLTRMTIDTSGKVGIGTTAPGSYLELNVPDDLRPGGSAARSNILRFQGGQGGSIWGQRWNFDVMGYADSTSSRLVIAAGNNSTGSYATSDLVTIVSTNGYVGIGTAAPADKLSINGGNIAVGYGSVTDVYVKHQTDSRSWWTGVGYSSGDDKYLIYDNTSGQPRLVIDTSGNVGIGTTSPGSTLSVTGTMDVTSAVVGSTAGNYQKAFALNAQFNGNTGGFTAYGYRRTTGTGWTNATYVDGIDIDGSFSVPFSSLRCYYERNASSQYHAWGTGSSEFMRLNSSGALSVAGSGTFGAYAVIGTSVSGGYYQDSANGAYRAITASGDAGYYFQTNGGGATRLFVGLVGTYAGRVGVGTTTPICALDVAGDVAITNNNGYWARNGGGTPVRLMCTSGDDIYLGSVDNAGGKVVIREDGSDVITLTGASVGINTSAPDARLDVQVNSGQGINVLEVKQEDTNMGFINFSSTDVGSSGTHLVNTAAVGTYYGKIKIAVNGTYRYVPVYNS